MGAGSEVKNEQHLDNRAAWALQEEWYYQCLEDEYNSVKHRGPRYVILMVTWGGEPLYVGNLKIEPD